MGPSRLPHFMPKLRPQPRPIRRSDLTFVERLYLAFEQSPRARALGMIVLVLPATLAIGIFFWSVSFKRPVLRTSPLATAAGIDSPPLVPVPDNVPASRIPDGMRMPAEFERQDGMLLGCNELVEFHPRVMLEMIAAMNGKLELYGLVSNAEQRQKVVSLLEEHKMPADSLRLIEIPASGMWVRDYGPKFLRNEVGGLTMIDYAYLDVAGTDGRTRPEDDVLPGELSKLFRTPISSVALSMEGGNLLNNGYGFVVSTSQLVLENSHRRYSIEDVGRLLNAGFGQENWSYVNFLDADTTRHADTFMTITAPDTIVIASCDPQQDPVSAATLDRAAEQLSQVKPDTDKHSYLPFKIVRIPMEMKGDGVMRTYTNVVFANGTLLVPQYSDVDPALNAGALQIYRKTMPGWKVVGIECLSVANMGGALHCITCNVPSPSMLPLDLNK